MRSIDYSGENAAGNPVSVHLLIHHAGVVDGLLRSRLEDDARRKYYPELKTGDEILPAPSLRKELQTYAAIYMHPRCVACSIGKFDIAGEVIDVADLSAEAFGQLPEDLFEQWIEAIFAENPAWVPAFMKPAPTPAEQDTAEKKI